MGKPRNTQKYPTYPEIPEIKKDTQKYPILYFDTPTRPDPTRYPVFCPIPDPILKNPTRWALTNCDSIPPTKTFVLISSRSKT